MNNKLIISILLMAMASSNLLAAKSNWKFRVFNSYSVTGTDLTKTPLENLSNIDELRANVNQAASASYTGEDRKQYIQEMCRGYSEREKVEMARYLSELSSDIYDYSRSGAKAFGVGDVVTNDQQWRAIGDLLDPNRQHTPTGVCRDMTSNVSEFLLDCGVPKECISIESFRTYQGGHQVVQAGCEETYTINWSELYVTNNKDELNHDLNPNLVNTGIEHTSFDPETGKIIGTRQTELGAILAAVSGGEVQNPNYMPKLLMLEAQYSVMTLGLFKSKLKRGDDLAGLKMELEGSPTRWLHLGAGITYARNIVDGNSITSDQDIT